MLKIFLLISIFIFSDIAQSADYGCYSFCISRGGSDKACKGKCGEEDSYGDYRDNNDKYGHSNNNSNNSNNSINSNNSNNNGNNNGNEFEGVNMKCFKECRLSGDGYDTCRIMCKR